MLVPSHGPRRVGRYLLCDQVGAGGMATIHLARLLGPQGFSRTVAVKQLHPQYAQNPQFVAMLLDEARLAVRVRHVNVVSPLELVATEAELFIVMDYVNGESLANLLAASDTPLPPPLAAAILVQALLGLHAAHEATREQGDALGLVHRDVSPQNILVGQDGVARMVDFGIAKAVARTQTTDGGMVKGKLGYMAPEQIRLEAVDRRTDLFSAGVVLWEALTGTGLFVADTLGASIQSILHAEIKPPSRFNPAVTAELDAVVLKALQRDRDARFQDAMSMAAALQRATPLASALEVIEWVETLAGPELARRAELVKRAEATSWEASAASEPPPGASRQPGAASGRKGWAETVDVSSSPRRTPTLLGIQTPLLDGRLVDTAFDSRPGSIAGSLSGGLSGSGLIATGESTGVAVGGDREASPVAEGESSWSWRSIGLVLGIVLAGAAAAFGVLSQVDGPLFGPRQPTAEPVVLAVGAPAPAAPRPTLPEPPSPEPASESSRVRVLPSEAAALPTRRSAPHEESSPAADPPAVSRARASRAGSDEGSSSRSSASARRSAARKAEAASNRRAAAASDREPPRVTKAACNPPWVVNDQQVKVFKAECLR